ncbi:MAG: permease [Actinomycetota bacterium]
MALDTAPRPTDLGLDTGGRERTWLYVVLALTAVVAGIRLFDPQQVAWLRSLLVVFGALMVQAMPFVAIGALVSAIIEVFVPASAFAAMGRLPRSLQLPAAAVAGMAFPVCECGSVPVARRLARKGLAPSAAVTFMLAAPIVNPVVIASTFVAYRGRDTVALMVFGRCALGLIVAMAVGWVIGWRRPEELLKPDSLVEAHDVDVAETRWRRFFGHLTGDLVFMARFLILGGLMAATIQTFVPQTIVNHVANLPILSLLTMMGLAFLISICSESDAFVAASFVAFGPAAQLAFLVFGPMLDLKLGTLYAGTYSKGFLRTVVITVTATTLVLTLWIQVIWG